MTCIKNIGPCKQAECLRNRFVDATIWFIATSRNAFAVIFAGITATYLLGNNGYNPFSLTGILTKLYQTGINTIFYIFYIKEILKQDYQI